MAFEHATVYCVWTVWKLEVEQVFVWLVVPFEIVKDQTRPKPYGRHETYDLKNANDINDLSKKFSSINLNDQYESNAQKST